MLGRSSRLPVLALASLTAILLTAVAAAPSYADPADPTPNPALRAPRQTTHQTPEFGPLTRVARGDRLGQHDRQLLAEAERTGAKRVTVMMLTDRKRASSVAAGVRTAGGWTGMVNDRVGYVRASVPPAAVDRIARLRSVVAVDLDESVPLEDPSVATRIGARAAAVAPPGPDTPAANPYLPTGETGSVAFKRRHPQWDGRGVTIGILDSGVDLDHPALQTTSTGSRKIIDWVTATDPVLDGDRTWLPMTTSVRATPTFSYLDRTYTAPASGTYAVSLFSESITAASEPGGDVNRDGDATDTFGVLYDPATQDIWVDANSDGTFDTAEKIAPYGKGFQIGHFGVDDPATPLVESMPFVVQLRQDVDLTPSGETGTADFVNIGIVEDAHGTHVAGIAAGRSLFGGAMDGQAPGAQLVSSRACTWGGGCTAAALTDGMVDLVTNRGVDVVNMSIGGLPALNDANNARARLYDRLISDFGVQIFIAAGNSGPGVNTVGDPSVATDVVSVASSISQQTWLANYGSVVSSAQNLHTFSSRGPREDGGMKPDIAAPGSAVSTVPLWVQPSGAAETGYTLPTGYAMFNGTSMASPEAAGSAAVLLSATLDSGIAVTPRALRDALYSAAKPIRNVSVAGQGTGLLDVAGSWTLLQRQWTDRDYAVDAPVCTPLSGLLATPNRGPGLYNRCAADAGGQTVGTPKAYDIIITRTSGPAASVRHDVRLVGDDGTFTVRASLTLRRNRPMTLAVSARAQPGLHAAIVEIDDPATPIVDLRVPLTVVQAAASATPSLSATVERNLTTSLFVTVPVGARLLQVNLTGIATRSQTRFIAINPYGVPVDPTSTTACYTNYSDPNDSDTGACKATSRSYANPLPGIWQIEVEARRTSPFLVNPFMLTATVQGVTANPATQTIPQLSVNVPAALSWTIGNAYGPVSIMPRGGALASSSSARKAIADGAQQATSVVIPAETTSFTAKIGNPADQAADLDLYVFNEAGAIVGQSADRDSEESVTLRVPAAGTYRVLVVAYVVPNGTTGFDYLDAFTSTAVGQLSVPARAVLLTNGATVSVSGSLTATQVPSAGRSLSGELQVVSSEGALVGTATVLVAAVT